MNILLFFLLLINIAPATLAFTHPRLHGHFMTRPRRRIKEGLPHMILAPQTVDEAIPRFWLWLAMGNGALTVGIGQMPRLLDRHLTVQRLGGEEPKANGEELAIPAAFLLYPESPSVSDLEKVVRSELLDDIDALIANGPRDTYLAANGMLTYRAWQKAFLEGETKEKYNPLAVRVVFDPFNACSDAVNPPEAFEYIMKWRREGIQGKESTFGTDLVKSKILSYSAGISFVSIIAFVADIIYEEAVMADISHHLPFMS